MKLRAVWAVVPIKQFTRAKSRLAGILDDQQRQRLATSLGAHVLAVLAGHRELAGVLVVTDGTDVAEWAAARSTRVLIDRQPLGPAVDRAIVETHRLGGDAALVVMSDLPLLGLDDITVALGELDAHALVLAPDARDKGTNLLALRSASALCTCLGRHDSFAAHLSLAQEHVLRTAIVRRRGLAEDIDEPEDWRRVSAHGF